jgi:hypothetical protein
LTGCFRFWPKADRLILGLDLGKRTLLDDNRSLASPVDRLPFCLGMRRRRGSNSQPRRRIERRAFSIADLAAAK